MNIIDISIEQSDQLLDLLPQILKLPRVNVGIVENNADAINVNSPALTPGQVRWWCTQYEKLRLKTPEWLQELKSHPVYVKSILDRLG